MNNKKKVSTVLALAMVASLATAIPVFAETNPTANKIPSGMHNRLNKNNKGKPMTKPAVAGTVASVSGNTITVNQRGFGKNATTTTAFTVDATNASVLKGGATSTVSSISVGDMLVVQGTVSGTNVTATNIRDGQIRAPGDKRGENASSTSQIVGNGQPVVAGTVSSISGSTFTISNKSNVSYTIDASSAKFTQGNNTISIGDIKSGDSVVVQGTINGNSVVASTVIDQARVANTGNADGNKAHNRGFFAVIGQFFKNIFGF